MIEISYFLYSVKKTDVASEKLFDELKMYGLLMYVFFIRHNLPNYQYKNNILYKKYLFFFTKLNKVKK